MTNGEMVRALAKRERLSIAHCAGVLRAWSALAATELAAGRDVALADVGTLSPSPSGVRFRPAKAVRDARRAATAPAAGTAAGEEADAAG